jgi:CheY-like chemotaxis protein
MSALRKVLVVDDDPVVGKSFDRVLSGKGYAVITAANGEEALQKLAAEDYDVVYTDIKMPGMSGLEVAERVKARRPWTPVVIITGYGTDEQEARAKAAGVSSFLHKPLSPEMIEGSAREALVAAEPIAEPVIALPAEETAAPAKRSIVKNIALFFAAPFIALAYVIAFPFVGIAMLAWFGLKAAAKNRVAHKLGGTAKNIGLFVGAPFIALAYVVLFPFVGLAMLAWFGSKALMKRD